MKEFIGNPKDKLMNLMDPANPMMSGVVQNQDSYMKGKIAQRWYYDQRRAGAGRGVRASSTARPAGEYDFVDAVPLRGRRVHPRRHGLLHGDGPGDGRLPARGEGHQGRLPERVLLPAVPGDADRRGAEELQGVHGDRADGRSALDDRQPSDARDQGRVLRRDDRPERPGARSTAFRGSITVRPAWAAATCGPATSSPSSTT